MAYLELSDRAVAVGTKMLNEQSGRRFDPSFVKSVVEAVLLRSEVKFEAELDEQVTIVLGDAFGDVEHVKVKVNGPAIETVSNTVATLAATTRLS